MTRTKAMADDQELDEAADKFERTLGSNEPAEGED